MSEELGTGSIRDSWYVIISYLGRSVYDVLCENFLLMTKCLCGSSPRMTSNA